MFICKNCNYVISDGMVFCPECGAKYVKQDEKKYYNDNIPVSVIEQYLYIVDEKPQICLGFQVDSEKTIDACSVIVKGKNQFDEPIKDMKIVYSDVNSDNGEIFGNDKIITANNNSLRKMEIIIEKIAYDDGELWINEEAELLTEIEEREIDEKQICEAVYNNMLEKNNNCFVDKEIDYTDNEQHKKKEEEYYRYVGGILKNFKHFYIPEGIQVIPKDMFFGVSGITIHIPDSVILIDESAFGSSYETDNFAREENDVHIDKIPTNIKIINEDAFHNCIIDNFSLPLDMQLTFEDKKVLGNYGYNYSSDKGLISGSAFSSVQLNNIKDEILIIPQNTKVERGCFCCASGFKKALIPERVYIDYEDEELEYWNIDIFAGCYELEKIEVDEKNNCWKSENGILYDKKMTKLVCYPSAKKEEVYYIPLSITREVDIPRALNLKYIVDNRSGKYNRKKKINERIFLLSHNINEDFPNLKAIQTHDMRCVSTFSDERMVDMKNKITVYIEEEGDTYYRDTDVFKYIIKRNGLVSIIKKEKKEKIKKYWETHAEEKAALESEKKELVEKRDKLNAELDAVKSTIRDAKRAKNEAVPSETEKSKVEYRIRDLNNRRAKLGIFAGKKKKQIGEEIAFLEGRIESLEGKIEEEKKEKAEVEKKLTPAKARKKELDSELAPIKKRISAINAELTKDPEA